MGFIATLKVPSESIMIVFKAMAILLKVKAADYGKWWSASLIERMRNFDKDSVSPAQLAKLRKFT